MTEFRLIVVLAISLSIGAAIVGKVAFLHITAAPDVSTQQWHMRKAGDFPNIFAAGALVLEGEGAKVFDRTSVMQRQEALTGWSLHFYFPYPPSALLFFAPFALLPPLIGFLLWSALWTVSVCAAVWRMIPRPSTAPLTFLFSGVAFSTYCGQNGNLSAALLVIAFTFLDRSPAVAGIALGLLTYKPHLAVLPLAVMLFMRRRDVMIAAGITIVALFGVSGLLLGFDTWIAFARDLLSQSGDVQSGVLHVHQISPFVFARALTGNFTIGYIATIIVALAALYTVVTVWRRSADPLLRTLALTAAIPLTTPYANDYDLAIMAAPFVLSAQRLIDGDRVDGRPGFARYAILTLTVAALPLIASAIGTSTRWPQPAPIILFSLVLFAAWAAERESDRVSAANS